MACNLAIRGDLAQKSAELMIKVSWFAKYLKKNWPDVTVVPVVLGDTIMTGIVPAAWMFSRNERAVQIEAGLRSMAPEVIKQYKTVDPETFIDQQFHGKWMLLRNEPFPEQWDTFTSAAGSEYLFAPVDLNKAHLIREGYPEKNMWVTGGVVVDALDLKRKEKPKESIFNIYPQLEKGDWLRIDIHRRGNLASKKHVFRKKAIWAGRRK
jgi:UDP-N-acetylglucosamine 2-epimerase (non-hydrolysing)